MPVNSQDGGDVTSVLLLPVVGQLLDDIPDAVS